MKNKYYDDFLFKNIKKLVSENRLYTALNRCEEYVNKYPNDSYGLLYYVDILIKVDRIDDAEKIFHTINFESIALELTKQYAALVNLKLLNCKREYDKCLDIVIENYEFFEERQWNPIELLLYFKKKLGLLVDVDYSEGGYKISQITNYSEECAISCIKYCHFMVDEENVPLHYFNDDFPLEDIFYNIRNMLPLDNKTNNYAIENHYIFRYDNCGKVNNKTVNYIKVITLSDSNDIITMYPYENKEKIECINLTPEVKELPNQKRLSQIEKFNQRYFPKK